MVWMEKQIGEHIEGQPFVKTFEEIRTDRKTEVPMQKEKEQLEKYFQTLIKQLPRLWEPVCWRPNGLFTR